MTRIGTRLFVVLVFAAPVGLIAGDKETPEQAAGDLGSKSPDAMRMRGETQEWFAVARNGQSILAVPKLSNGTRELEPGEYERLVNRTSRKATIEAGEKFVFATDALEVEVEGEGVFFPRTYAAELNGNVRKTIRVTDEARVEAGKKMVMK